MYAFAERLNIQNCVNLTRYCMHYMYGLFWFTENMNSKNTLNMELHKFNVKLCTLYVRIVWICRFEYLKLYKFNEKLCTLDVWIMWICKKFICPELRKINGKLCKLYLWIVWICGKIKYPELRKFNKKLCIRCMHFLDLQKDWISRVA